MVKLKVQNLINQVANMNELTEAGEIPLHAFADEGWIEIAKLLIEKDVDFNVKDEDGLTSARKVGYEGPTEIAETSTVASK